MSAMDKMNNLMNGIDLVAVGQFGAAIILGGVIGLFISYLMKFRLPATALSMLAVIGFFIFPIW
ncbi:hypothetical protein AB6T85_22550 [Erwinia sp. ACCC 02193]|uniref:Uncharacterized protein n=1 Tax=Erwinia aeris TaxID=3239803 RepID=A0ABV4EE17_9GAMM